MTIASFENNADGTVWIIDITGHADYADGPDIVCSACSTLACTLLQALRKMEHYGFLRRYLDSSESGDVHIYMETLSREPVLAKVETILDTICDGYLMLQQKYPNNVKVIKSFETFDDVGRK